MRKQVLIKFKVCKGINPGLEVMVDESYSKGRGFESQRCILDGHFDIFSQCFVVKIVSFV